MPQYKPLSVIDIERETSDSVYITLQPNELDREQFCYSAGQYLSIEISVDKKKYNRCYSICDRAGGALRIGVRLVEGGVVSTYLNKDLQVEDIIKSQLPQGQFCLPQPAGKKCLFIASGSGITPVISLLRQHLAHDKHNEATLIYGNRSNNSMMFLEELSLIKNTYLQRLNWLNIFSRQQQSSEIFNGRIDNKKGQAIHQQLFALNHFDHYFICGPQAMISEVSRGLQAIGVSITQIYYELFASSEQHSKQAKAKQQQRAQKFAGKADSVVEIAYGGRTYSLEVARDGSNILDLGLSQGITLPYSCKAGICSTCMAKVKRGQVEMDVTQGLSQQEIDAGYVLCCQAHPITDKVVIEFE